MSVVNSPLFKNYFNENTLERSVGGTVQLACDVMTELRMIDRYTGKQRWRDNRMTYVKKDIEPEPILNEQKMA